MHNTNTPALSGAINFRPEIIDAISAVQSAHQSISSVSGIDPEFLEDLNIQERISEMQASLVSTRLELLQLLCDLAGYEW